MKKLGKKLEKAAKSVEPAVRHAVKDVEPAVRHAVQKVMVKLQLNSERDWARDALTSAEQGLTEINAAVQIALAIQAKATQSVDVARDEGDENPVIEQISIINTAVTTLLNAQERIVAQEKITREERDKISSIPNEMENPTEGERQGKEACRKAQDAAKMITDMLVGVRNDLRTTQAAQQAIIILLGQEGKVAGEQSGVVAPPPYAEDGEEFVLVAAPEIQNPRLVDLIRQRQAIEQAINAELAAGGVQQQNAPGPVTMLRDARQQNPQQPAQNNPAPLRLANSGFL